MRVIVCWLLLVLGAFAAESLTCKLPVRGENFPLRKGGTVILDAELTNHSGSILEGRLEVAVLEGGRRISTHIGPELVIPPGKLKTQMFLPPPLDPGYGEGFATRIAFAMKDHSIPLGDHPLGNFPSGGHDFILAIGRSSRRASEIDNLRERSARLETLRSTLEAQAWFATPSLSVPTEDFPGQSIGWFAYDVVLLDSAAFAELTPRQLEAMASWIEAGGSAIIFAEGTMRERQLAFLRRIAGKDANLETDNGQRLVQTENRMLTLGMGRVLLVPSPPKDKAVLENGAWKWAIAWVWKVRPQWRDHIEEHGTWPILRPDADEDAWIQRPVSLENWARTVALEVDRKGVERPRPLPIGWVALLLSALLILVGPVDWYVLGWLRRRRLTWVLFPTLCAIFAWGASRMASQYLGPRTRSTSVRVTDLGEGDRVLRDVVIRLRVPMQDEEWTTESTDGLCAAMLPKGSTDQMGRFEAHGELPETRAEWQSHSRVVLRQNMRQWTPNWQQAVSIGGPAPDVPDWKPLIDRWNHDRGAGLESLGGPLAAYSIFFVPEGGWRPGQSGQVTGADSSIDLLTAMQLGTDTRPLPDVLEAISPVLVAGEALGAGPRGALSIIAWRQVPEGLHVLRRHVSKREMAESQ